MIKGKYTIKVGGLESLAEYPYIAEDGTPGNCSFNASDIVASISGIRERREGGKEEKEEKRG
jgi:hypothetical protein